MIPADVTREGSAGDIFVPCEVVPASTARAFATIVVLAATAALAFVPPSVAVSVAVVALRHFLASIG